MVTTTYMIIEGDSRLTNARTPTSHASTHGFSGSDPLPQATASQSGLLASTDFTTFSNKQDAALINDWSSASSTNYPSSSLVKAKIAECEPTENKVSSWSSTTTNVHFPSEKLVKDSLDEKQATLPTAFLYVIPPNANLTKSSKDSDGVYLVYTWTLTTAVSGYPAKWVSTLNSSYTTRTMVVYGSDKSTVLATYTFTRTLDSDGNLVSEVLQ